MLSLCGEVTSRPVPGNAEVVFTDLALVLGAALGRKRQIEGVEGGGRGHTRRMKMKGPGVKGPHNIG